MGMGHRGTIMVLTVIVYNMLISYRIFLYDDPSDRIGGHKDVEDEIHLNVR